MTTNSVNEEQTSAGDVLDPLGDAESGTSKNRARVGSARPSSLLYTYGPGSIMDLPGFSVMPTGLDDWEPIWKRRGVIPTIEEKRLLDVVRMLLGHQVTEMRPFPWQPKTQGMSREGEDLGIPARVFPQWMRCTVCDYLGPLTRFTYTNTHPFRPDLATFTHPSSDCTRIRGRKKKVGSPAVPAQHLLTCANGHLDEFPYDLWVHRGGKCKKAEAPDLKMIDTNSGKSVGATIECLACGARRGMAEAQGPVGREKLPQKCLGRHPHLNRFDTTCTAQPALIMMGASNLWFASTQSVIVMPRDEPDSGPSLATMLLDALGPDTLSGVQSSAVALRAVAQVANIDLTGVSDKEICTAAEEALAGVETEDERRERAKDWDPVELLVPEWRYLQKPAGFPQHEDAGGLQVTEMDRFSDLDKRVDRVVAVNKMKKVNAVLGFTRLDEMDRVNDLISRLVPLRRSGKPTWVPATVDRGEGVFLQLDLDAVEKWEAEIENSRLWKAHQDSHARNFRRRFSETAKNVEPETRMPPPRYWLLHTFSHTLIREMAMSSGYGAASLTERIYAWQATPERDPAAGVLICTTASDSEGTLGGLVALSEPERFHHLVDSALRRATRCSSDPVCACRTPEDPEDFLHGAACHCCTFASETSCERANRFLDRRFLVTLPQSGSYGVPGFFGSVDVR